jgi:hypothetical protein
MVFLTTMLTTADVNIRALIAKYGIDIQIPSSFSHLFTFTLPSSSSWEGPSEIAYGLSLPESGIVERYDSICMNRGDPDIYIRGPVFISCNNVAPVTNLSIVCHNRKLRKAELF